MEELPDIGMPLGDAERVLENARIFAHVHRMQRLGTESLLAALIAMTACGGSYEGQGTRVQSLGSSRAAQFAERVLERMLWLSPSDNQGIRMILPEVRAREAWVDGG